MSLADQLRAHIDERRAAGLCILCDRPNGSCEICLRVMAKAAAQWDDVFALRPDTSAITRDIARGT